MAKFTLVPSERIAYIFFFKNFPTCLKYFPLFKMIKKSNILCAWTEDRKTNSEVYKVQTRDAGALPLDKSNGNATTG